ncbi:MAG: tRNA (N(6)-L-threonylcarbamoyladenosine(37)-C(2))-methylthiotransferase [Desulfurococcales archaeon]|nr:tRNA (N(6)-L-threonylcarbamoyladenosine(37)-C(2))-methylthiotransferase [Desulfurococcales archaeon]
MRVYIETYGCALNRHDTLTMVHYLGKANHVLVKEPGGADAIIVNTCAVRLETEKKIIKRLDEIKRIAGNKLLVIAGCLAAARPYLLAKQYPGSVLVSPQNVHLINSALENRQHLLSGIKDRSVLPAIKEGEFVATLAVAEGCLSDCSFCITKIARRRVSSVKPRVVVESVKKLVSAGVKEIRLTAQDLGVYGVDLPGQPSLADLLRMILDKVKGDYMIRVGMASPEKVAEFLDDLIEIYQDPRVYKFFHLPVQSGDDRVLRLMNRKYTVDEYISLVKEIRKKVRRSFIATDIIVGHPGEDDEAFENTLRLVRELRFERVHIARYSFRPRTRAGKMKQIPEPVKKKRSSILSDLVRNIGEDRNSRYVGQTIRARPLEKSFKGGWITARMIDYTPVVIPERLVNGLMGRWLNVRVTGFSFFDLRGIPAQL